MQCYCWSAQGGQSAETLLITGANSSKSCKIIRPPLELSSYSLGITYVKFHLTNQPLHGNLWKFGFQLHNYCGMIHISRRLSMTDILLLKEYNEIIVTASFVTIQAK